MKATIHFKDKQEPELVLYGIALGVYESGSYTQVKDYGVDHLRLIASIPTANIQAIGYEREPEVKVTVKEI